MESWEQIEKLIKNIASMIKSRDDRTYTGKYSDLNCDICMKTIKLADIMKEHYKEEK